MAHLIDKDALVAEIEKIIKTNKECMLGLRNLDYYQGKVDALNGTLSFIDSMQEEPVSEDLEEAAKNHAVERFRITRNRELAEKCKWSYITGAEWLFERVKEALLSEVLPCFMHGGEADEVVAKLDEVLNFQKKLNYE